MAKAQTPNSIPTESKLKFKTKFQFPKVQNETKSERKETKQWTMPNGQLSQAPSLHQ